MKSDKIYLVGFMAAGKSTVAKALARCLGWSVEDLDELIENREQRSVSEIFATDGEAGFRRMERALLQELRPRRHVVVATGGGTFADSANRALIAGDGASVWLDVSFQTVVERLPSDGTRPLASDRTTMQALWHARRPAYSLAQLQLPADDSAVDDLVAEILSWLES
jgi:shikimate kinase